MMNTLGRRSVAALMAGAIALGVLGATTTAGAGDRRTSGVAGLNMPLALAGGRATKTSVGAGYFAYPGNYDGMASVGATFRVPATSCQHTNDVEWLLPGIWVFQNGLQTQEVGVNMDCDSGGLERFADICVTGTCRSDLAVSPGDVVEASLVYTGSDTVGTVRDRTRGTASQVVGAVDDSDTEVFVGALGPIVSGVSRVPAFTSVPFTSVQINGQYLSDWTQMPYNLETGRAVQIKTGAITRDQDFTITFAHN